MFISKCLNPWLPYVTKIKFKGKSTKVLYACMVHGERVRIFFIEEREELCILPYTCKVRKVYQRIM